jgi:cell wall-associated NlpC family hydrolase
MSRFFLVTALLLFPASALLAAPPPAPFAVAREAVPVFSDPAHPVLMAGAGEAGLPHDPCGQVGSLEFVSLPATPFRVHECSTNGRTTVCRVATDAYPEPVGKHLYLDASFLSFTSEAPPPRRSVLPSREELQRLLEGRLGTPYVWGGNLARGVGSGTEKAFRGVDCSGLLYEVTDGFTLRNTSELIRFGKGVSVNGLSAADLAARLEPLDLLVWDGHVIIVLDRERTIESRLDCGAHGHGGVVIRPLAETVARLLAGRKAADEWPVGGGKFFVVRRWYGTGR